MRPFDAGGCHPVLGRQIMVIVDFAAAKQIMADKIREGIPNTRPTDVFRIEVKIHPIDEIAWIAQQKSPIKIFGANQDNTASIAGVGEAASVRGQTSIDLKKIFAILRRHLKPQYPYMQWYGGICFDPGRLSKDWENFGAYRFVLPRFELASNASAMIFCCNIVGKPSKTEIHKILKQLEALTWETRKSAQEHYKAKRQDMPSRQQWDKTVRAVLKMIEQSQLKKIVLARQTKLKFAHDINPWDILRRLVEVTPNSYHFCFQFGTSSFVGASPERLYRKYGQAIISEAIAGTVPKGLGVSQDNALKEKLLASSKDQREHALVVDDIDRSFQRFCQDYRHATRPEILTIGNGHHLRTAFEGRLKPRVLEEEIVQSLHPTPAVGGVPFKKALQTLARREGFPRGWYTGLIGYVGLDRSEFVVGIRSALVKGKEMAIYAGAGIVEGSEAESEWQEIENKIDNFIKIIK